MKKILVTCLVILNLIVLGGCSEKADTKADIKTYPVKIVELKDESYPVSLEYEGLTGGSEVRMIKMLLYMRCMQLHSNKLMILKLN